MKVATEEAVRMSDGKLFHAVGPATQNAWRPRRRLVRGTTRSPRAAERRAARVETVVHDKIVHAFLFCFVNCLLLNKMMMNVL